MKPTHPQIPAKLCGPFEGAHLLSTAPITGLFAAPIPANARLVAGEVDSVDGQQLLAVTGRSPLQVPVEVSVFEKDWDKLILLLDSPLALCHAARWLATRLGMDPGATAPTWLRSDSGCWELSCVNGSKYFLSTPQFGIDIVVPGISDLTDPAAALAAACVAVGGAL